jgi:hypothetical protein
MNSIIVNIEHTVEEVNTILLALADRPFKEVNDLINKIRGSAMTQIGSQGLAAPTPEAEPEATEEPASDVSVL